MADKKISKKHSPVIESKDTYKIILENLPNIVFTKNSDFVLTYINPEGERILGKPSEEIVGKDDFQIFPPKHAKELREKDEEVLNSNETHESFEEIGLNGKKIVLKNQKIPLVDQDGNQFILGISQDVTEFKQKESELNNSLSFVESLIESSQDGLLVVDHISRKVIKVNSAFFDLWKIPTELKDSHDDEKLLGFAVSQLEDPSQFISLVEDLYDRPKDMSSDEIKFRDGRVFARTSFPQLIDGQPIARIWNFRDITQQKEREKELEIQRSLNVHQAKMASIGELAAGVGHEINNPLAIAVGYLSNLQKKISDGKVISNDDLITQLEKVQKANQRITDIVKGLRSLSHTQSDISKPFSVIEAVKGSFELIEEIYKKNGINIKLNQGGLEPSLAVKGDQGKLQQILMNLIANAKDAIEQRKDKEISIKVSNNKEFVRIEVQDNGFGIPESVQKDIFNPFFTTKDINKGTGIGLSLVANFVKEMKGFIDFETSELGTTFCLRFPIDKNQEIHQPTEKAFEPASKMTNSGKVLIVDDEEDIREILEEILQEFGFETISASNGQEGYEILKERAGDFDIVVSDVKMPKMTGFDFISEVYKLKLPEVPKFIFSTGGVNVDLEKQLQYFPDVIGFFYKPFDHEDVEKVLSQLKDFNVKKAA